MGENKLCFWGSNQNSLLSPVSLATYNRPQQNSTSFDIIDISASEKHVSFITKEGALYSYGVNLDGRLGVGGRPEAKCTIQNPLLVKLNARAVKVKCGFSHVVVQLINDEIYSWGLGQYGSLGTGQLRSKSIPTRVILKEKIVNFSCGAMHTGFVDADGKVYLCGSNQYGEIGANKPDKVATPTLIDFNHKVKQVECGVFYTLLLTSNGQVYGMGNNKYSQLGIGNKINQFHPTHIKQLDKIVLLAAGYHSGAIDCEGNLYIWGCGSFGQFTRPRKISLQVPVNLLFIRGFFGVAISTSRDRKVYTWGNNSYGQLGCGSIESAKEPIEVSQLQNIKLDNFACGVNFFIATTKDKDIVAALVKDYQSDYKSQYSSNRKKDDDYIRNFASKSKTAVKESERNIDQLVKSSIYREALFRQQGRSSAKKKESHKMFDQQVLVSKSCRNYQELFISLSADYETLLGRYKQMEINLQQKNKSQICQIEQENITLRAQNIRLRALEERNMELEEQLSSKSAELRQYRQKRQFSSVQLAQQAEDLNTKLEEMESSYKSTKQELKKALKKISKAQQQLSNKSMQMKQKRSVVEENDSLKLAVKSQNEQIEEFIKNNKALKEELRSATKKLKEIEESLQMQRDSSKDSLQRLNKKEYQLETLNNMYQQKVKQGKETNISLKNFHKQIENLQEELANKQEEIAQLEKKYKSKQQQLRRSQKKNSEQNQSKTQRGNQKDLQIQIHLKKIANLQNQVLALRLKQKQLLITIEEVNKSKQQQLLKKEQAMSQILREHQIVQTDLCKEISALEQDKQKINELNEKLKSQKQQLKQQIQWVQQDLKKCQDQLMDSFKNLDRMKQVHDLNDIRVSELKTILKKEQENAQSTNSSLSSEIKRLQEEKKQFLKLIQQIKDKKGNESGIYQDKILQIQNEKEQLSQQVKHLEIELSYQKQYHAKCQFSIKDLTQSRDNAFREKLTLQEEIQKMKEKAKEQTLQLQKSKSYRKDIEVLSLQLQRVQSNASKYKQQIEELLKEKEEVVRQLRKELEKKQKEVEAHEEKYGNDTGKLNRQIKDLQRKLGEKTKELSDAKKINDTLRSQLDNEKESSNKNQRKLVFKDQQLEKEIKEHEKTTQQFNNLRRQYARQKSDIEELQDKNQSNQSEKRQLQGRFSDKKKEIETLQAQIKRIQGYCDGLRRQSQFAKSELQQSNWALQQANRLNGELQRANEEFSANQQHYNSKISQLQAKIFEMQQQNKSYTPRYESMMERNRELEDRNRQLSDMVNRAIQIQAEAYKTNILKEVKINTGEILQQIKEEQEYKSKNRRKQQNNNESQTSKVEIENAHQSFDISNTPKLTQEPYTKLMNQKISAHKKKLSESAQKLAGILSGSNQDSQIEESHTKQFVRSINRRDEDYEIVNNQMDSLNQQKTQFIQKITSFAQKLKIL